tara:strand:+ start:3305 stop:3727 length:423 start_codon:yes stop_codon:yes gene_type:complete
MSGIIGGLGSNSGIIGQTETDYEEGTWTMTHGWMTCTNNHTGQYTKVGNMVHVYADVTITGASDSSQTGGRLGGFPFNGKSGINLQSPYLFRQGGSWWYSYELGQNDSTLYIYQSSGGVIVVRSGMNGSRLLINGTYLTN